MTTNITPVSFEDADRDPASASAREPLPHVRVTEDYDLPSFDEWMACKTDEERRAGA